jgi:hypothetical protein
MTVNCSLKFPGIFGPLTMRGACTADDPVAGVLGLAVTPGLAAAGDVLVVWQHQTDVQPCTELMWSFVTFVAVHSAVLQTSEPLPGSADPSPVMCGRAVACGR